MGVLTRAEMFWASVDEVDEASTAVEFGEKNSGICLGFRTFYPLQARSNATIFTTAFAKDPTSITTHSHVEMFS